MNRFSIASLPGHQLVLHPLLPVWNVCQDLCLWVERLPVVQEQHLWWFSHSSVVGKTASAAPVSLLGNDHFLHFSTSHGTRTRAVALSQYSITSICSDDGTKFLFITKSFTIKYSHLEAKTLEMTVGCFVFIYLAADVYCYHKSNLLWENYCFNNQLFVFCNISIRSYRLPYLSATGFPIHPGRFAWFYSYIHSKCLHFYTNTLN